MSRTAKTNIILIIITAIVAFFAIFFAIRSDKIIKNNSVNGLSTNAPTIYIHGLGGSNRSTKHLTTIASRDGGQHALTVTVDDNGTIKYRGHLSSHMRKPIVQIIFKKKFTPVYQQVDWLRSILLNLRKKYHVKAYNAVGHSTGAVTVLDTVARYHKVKGMPILLKFVSIAGPYDGLLHLNDRNGENYVNYEGKPMIFKSANKWLPSYESLIEDCKKFPKHVSVLNIYGNDNHHNESDGVVSVASARSLRYLVFKRVKDYEEIPINGFYGQHSRLHHNVFVDHLIARFLFDRN